MPQLSRAPAREEQPQSIEERAAEMAIANEMARMDPLALMVEGLAQSANLLAESFNAKAEKNARLPERQQLEQLDTTALKEVIDAQHKAITAAIEYRAEQ